MTRDEQKAITAFVEQAVAGTQPELDVEADAIIRALFVRNPEAAYRVTMLAMAQAGELNGRTDKISSTGLHRSKFWFMRLLPKPNLPGNRREPVLPTTFRA